MRLVEWNAAHEIVSDVTQPEHTHAPPRALKRSRAEGAVAVAEAEGEQEAAPAAEAAENEVNLQEEEGPQKKAKQDILELDEYRWTLQHHEDNCTMYKCVDCEAVKLVVVDADNQVLMDVTEPEHTHPRVAVIQEEAIVETPPIEEKPIEDDEVKDEEEPKKNASGKRSRRGVPDRERAPRSGYVWQVVEDSGDKRVAVCLDCPAMRTVTWNDELRVVADVTEPPHTHALQVSKLAKKRQKQRKALGQKAVGGPEEVVSVNVLPEPQSSPEPEQAAAEPEAPAASSGQGSSKRRSDTKYRVPDDGYKWQFGTTQNKGSVVSKRMGCSVVTCKAVRKLRYDVLHGNLLLKDRVIGSHNH
jgi:hypothetical protein